MEHEETNKFGYNIKENNINLNLSSITDKSGVERTHPFLQNSFVSLILGKPGSGKTHLIQNLILNEKLYYKFFNYIYVISPYCFNPEICVKGIWFSEFDTKSIYENIISKHHKLQKNKDVVEQRDHILIVIDDFVSKLSEQQNNSALIDLFYTRRHIIKNTTISFILTSQKYTMIPSKLRAVLTSIYMFSPNPVDMAAIYKEVGFIKEKLLKDIITRFLKDTHSFILLNLDSNKIFADFDEIKYNS